MNFKDLQCGYNVYVFDRANIECKMLQVITVSQPRFENKIGQAPTMVMDLTICDNGVNKTFVVPDSATRAFADNIIISTGKDAILAEVRALKQNSDSVIASVDKHRQTSDKCAALLADLDVDYKNKMESDARLTKMEQAIEKLTRLMADQCADAKKNIS